VAGIDLEDVANCELVNNTCNNDWAGIVLSESNHNLVEFNTCSNNDRGISLSYSDHNTIAHNNCSNNLTGIYLHNSNSNNLDEKDFSGSEFDILEDREPMEDDLVAFLWTLQLAGIIMLVAGWRIVSLSRFESKEE